MTSLSPDPTPSTTSSSTPSPSSPSSEATTPTQPNSLSTIRYEHRIFVTGMTGSGKSELAKALFLSTPLSFQTSQGEKRARRLIVDPADSSLTASAADKTFSDPSRVPDVATARFVPKDPEDKDAYNKVYNWAFSHYPGYVWLDEAGVAAPATGYPRSINTFVIQGRKRQLGHLACHVRPREVAKNLLAQSTHLFIFRTPNVDDRKYVAETVGIPFAVLEREMNALGEYGFVHYNVANNTLTTYPEGLVL